MEIFEKNWDLTRSVSTSIPNEGDRLSSLSAWGPALASGLSGGLLIFAPLAYGAVHPWAYFTIGVVVSVLSLVFLSVALFKVWASPGKRRFLPRPPLWWLALGLGLLGLIQIMPWPQGVVRWLSPTAWHIRTLGSGAGWADYMPLSLNPYATLLEVLKLWPAVVFFFILIYTINSRKRIYHLIYLIIAVALLEVLYGFWHFRTHLIWGWKNHYTGLRLCGTFINSNHLAFFLTMAILLGFGLLLAQKRPSLPLAEGSSATRLRKFSRPEHLEDHCKGMILGFILVVLTVGLIFTASRGGMIALTAGFILISSIVWGQRWKRGYILVILAFLATAVLYSLLLGSAPFLARLENLSDKERYLAMKGALNIFRDYPWIGSGIATFGEVFYRYAPVELQGKYFLYTHNDWLQLLSETGITGFLLVAAAGGLFFANLLKQWFKRHDPFARYVGLGGIAALGAATLYSLGEFPLHIPALSLLFAAMAAITYVTVYSPHQGEWDYFSYPTFVFPRQRWLSTIILLGLMGTQVAFLYQVCYQWTAEMLAPTEFNSTLIPPKLESKDFRRALVLNPRNSKLNLGLAEALEKVQGVSGQDRAEVENSLKAAVFNAPSHWGYRLKLAEFYLRQQEQSPAYYIPAALEEFTAAVSLCPESGALHFRLALILTWADKYFSGLVPAHLSGRSQYYYKQAVRLDPQLQRFISQR